MMRKLSFALLGCMISGILLAQKNLTGESAEMADAMRSNGKIYVVVAVILIIFIGLIIYLIRLDRKITRLEKHSPIK